MSIRVDDAVRLRSCPASFPISQAAGGAARKERYTATTMFLSARADMSAMLVIRRMRAGMAVQ